ncbi:XRE family transcriptional regulator [Tsukamurella pulmonis]|uniref:Putative transcriptional regulator n=1 Tax=Tsukamurella pulmonis TaxID=47312 RepID=A0A1H1AYV4_9ACTN|nr:helix-turn-helix transcriptional regulator [Tsukamurella pulmonis]KXO92823.1 XRE family transcriptional regulator [Tsukamurella pulmonis]KXP08149.1 XRE family transcriptional regulator [Tsukamurella pulmonis]RDH10969.1 transcriptional regulator [Tsukamurella pulmonis]SDQ44356.1 putative transcriptional regulator [Tsukamurella pulmonis]SUP25959.1 anaerobic benzoate catabolism transcriptional regulator [Tsukamurella pulmonis]
MDDENPVRVRRRAERITQAELAAAVGVSRQTVVSVEKGDYAPSVYLALRIARALDSTVEDLFPLKEDDHVG